QLRQQQIQLLSNQLADIEPIATVLYSELEAEYDELSNLENLMQQAALSVQLLDNDSDEPDVISLLNRAIKLCEAHTELSQTYADCVEQLYLAHTQIAEVASTLSNYAEGQSLDPKRLALLDEQLS
ncbi:DNA repair protein RecN, partial [Salmonella enterica subsp. enterica serovar Enteritidis]|nr:DNA repair protein RecN [Salmonella enterica subsp. enterica serovar Enteritidis]